MRIIILLKEQTYKSGIRGPSSPRTVRGFQNSLPKSLKIFIATAAPAKGGHEHDAIDQGMLRAHN